MGDPEIQLERLRWPEIRQRIAEGWTTVIVATGAVEQHGPHLPLFMDSEHGTHLAQIVARKLGQTLVAPTVRIGCSEHHMAFPGTISLRQETYEAVMTDYVTSLAWHGFQRILILPTHGGNFGPLAEMEARLQEAAGNAKVICYTNLFGLVAQWRDETEAAVGLGERVGGHADIAETAVMLTLHPDLVRMDLAEAGFQAELSADVLERIIKDGLDTVTHNGILGDARGATAALGERLVAVLADAVASHFQNA